MTNLESRVSALESLFAGDPSKLSVPVLMALSDVAGAVQVELKMTFGPWKQFDVGGDNTNLERCPMKECSFDPALGSYVKPFIFYRHTGNPGFYIFGIHRKCTRAEFDTLLPELKQAVDNLWLLMGARLLNGEP